MTELAKKRPEFRNINLKPLGVEVRDLPLSPARLWQMVNR